MASAPSRLGPQNQHGQSCRQCRHYYITHDPSFPYGCRALDFKGKRPPIHTVLAASGQACQYFQSRPQRQK